MSSPQIKKKLLKVLEHPIQSETFQKQLNKLESLPSENIYSEMILLLSNLEFSEEEARAHWDKIMLHRDDMKETFGRDVDFRVAMLDYFIDVDKKLISPKVLEIQVFIDTENSVIIDELTGIYNYRYFIRTLRRELARAQRHGHHLSLMLLDIDDFKFYNDTNGHLAGNIVLRKLAGSIRKSLRNIDVLARFGGEEFAVLLPETGKDGAGTIAARLMENVSRQRYKNSKKQPGGRLSISGGISNYPIDAERTTDLIELADKALYTAKRHGKNRIYFFSADLRTMARIQKKLKGYLYKLSDKRYSFETLNISEGGAALRTGTSLPLGCMIHMSLRIKAREEPIQCMGRVVESTKVARRSTYVSSIKFIDINQKDRHRMRKYIIDHVEPSDSEKEE